LHRNGLLLILFCLSPLICGAEPVLMDKVHFLIPAGPGGGWDGTARGVGEALVKSGLVTDVRFENLSGGGGGRAIAKLIETASRQQHTLLISSTPIVVRSLQGIFPQSFRDLEVIASVIADYTAIAVRKDSPIATFGDLAARFRQDPRSVKFAGGSVRGSTDHFIAARALQLTGADPKRVVYVPYDGGGKAMAGLLTAETQVLSSGLSEMLEMHRAGEIRIIGITAPNRIPEANDIPTLVEQDVDLVFGNWRGFFAAKGLPESRYQEMISTVEQVAKTEQFQEIRRRNGWSELQLSGDAFYGYLVKQEKEIGALLRELGYLK
jgi:putative tricarboxylic transport membrane protein